MASGNGIHRFVISILPDARARLRELGRTADERGLLAEYLADVRQMNERLEHMPKEFGDQTRDFRHAKLAIYRGLTEYLIVHYGVHTERPIVFVQSIALRPDRPLGSTP